MSIHATCGMDAHNTYHITTFITTAPYILISQTTDDAPQAIHTASIDQIRNDPQHLSSIERPTMWYG